MRIDALHLIFGFMLLVTANTATAQQGLPAERTVPEPSFASVLAAVQAATGQYSAKFLDESRSESLDEGREFSGPVFELGGHFYYGVFAGFRGQDVDSLLASLPRGANIVALWYTRDSSRRVVTGFSYVKATLAKRWSAPVYEAGTTGVLRIHLPNNINAGVQSPARQWQFARGRSVITFN